MSAVGVSAELYITQIGHPPNLSQTCQHVGRYPIVHGQNHHCGAARRVGWDLHAGDVDVVLAQDGADLAEDPWAGVVAADQAAAYMDGVAPKRICPSPALAAHQDR